MRVPRAVVALVLLQCVAHVNLARAQRKVSAVIDATPTHTTHAPHVSPSTHTTHAPTASPTAPSEPTVPEMGSLMHAGVARWGNYSDVFTFKYMPSNARVPSISVTTPDGVTTAPLGVLSTQRCLASSWSVPLEATSPSTGTCEYHRAVKQVCPHLQCADPGEVTVALTALTTQPVPYNLTVTYVNTSLTFGVNHEVEVASWMPRFFYIEMGDYEAVDVLITSTDSQRAVASVQNASCPVYDEPWNVEHGSRTQTLTTQAQIYVPTPGKSGSLFLVLVLDPTVAQCNTNTTSTFVIRVTPSLSTANYLQPAFKLLALYLAVYVAVVLVWLARKCAPLRKRLQGGRRPDDVNESTLAERSGTNMSMSAAVFNNHRVKWDDGSYTKFDKFFFRSKSILHVSDLARKVPSLQERKSLRYLWYLVVISIFYFLPVGQLVLGYVDMFRHGDEDQCFFNFRCAHPLGRFRSFNNIFSNVGFVLLGSLFILIVKYRAHTKRSSVGDQSIGSEFDRDLGSSKEFTHSADDLGAPDTARGIPPNLGVFYAVGYAILCEGLFSACYHVCPNPKNFQFDSSFMYVIALLLILALHQKRHSDLQTQPQWPYLVVGVFISLLVIGIYWGEGNPLFFILLFCVYVPLSIVGAISMYLVAPWRWKFSIKGDADDTTQGIGLQVTRGGLRSRRPTNAPIYEDEFNDSDGTPLVGMATSRPTSADDDHFMAVRDQTHFIVAPTLALAKMVPFRKDRAVLILLLMGTNWGLLLYGIAVRNVDIPSFILLVLLASFFVYLAHYVCMKVIRKEVLTWKPLVCLVCAIIAWVPALAFFNTGLVTFDEDAAYSREGNSPCVLWGFFDAHDVWHISSSLALFFSALVLLTIDDDLADTPRTKIQV
eukprot:m.174090 g.174090  ORF g.174090 m.174090 type:complete len:882 (-) comp13789_c0_seq1:122-2767(-)